MEKHPALDVQAAAAEFPVRRQQKMKTEYAKLVFLEDSLGDQIKIGHIIFAGPGPGAIDVMSLAGHQRHFAAIRFIDGAKIKPFETRPKNIAQDTVARRFPVAVQPWPQAGAVALGTSHVGESDRLRVRPLHGFCGANHYRMVPSLVICLIFISNSCTFAIPVNCG
jgi:hypothetical protein